MNMSKSVRRMAPRRPIDKGVRQFISSLGTTQLNDDLRVSDESETIIRIVGNISWRPTTNAGEWLLCIYVVREDEAVPTLDTSTRDVTRDDALLWSHAGTSTTSVVGYGNISIDVKSKRKLKKGDRIVFSAIASDASVIRIHFALTSFYKQ